MTTARILIACIGNIFLGDDGFGSEVARELSCQELPPEVVLKDFGIRGLDLTYALLDPYELVILVDACSRGLEPGTIYLIEPNLCEPDDSEMMRAPLDAHSMNPMNVLRAAHSMGGAQSRILLVGCEPASTGSGEDGQIGLSAAVQAAVPEAVNMIGSLVSKALRGQWAESVLQPH